MIESIGISDDGRVFILVAFMDPEESCKACGIKREKRAAKITEIIESKKAREIANHLILAAEKAEKTVITGVLQ